MKHNVVEIKGHKFHIIIDGYLYKIFPDGKCWYSTALAIDKPLETAIEKIEKNFFFYIS